MVLPIVAAIPWILKIGGAIIAVMGTVTLINFLYEEALQTAGMGVWVAISNKQWDAADKALKSARSLLSTANFVYNTFGWLSPFSWNVFKNYAKATELQYDTYETVISTKKGTVSDPSAPGKVFNLIEAKNNIAKGTAPTPESLVAGVTVTTVEDSIDVQITEVIDGDTMKATTLEIPYITIDVRVLGMNAPDKNLTVYWVKSLIGGIETRYELKAADYKAANSYAVVNLQRAFVTLFIDPANRLDKYNRVLAKIKYGAGTGDFALDMVRKGLAVAYFEDVNKYVNQGAIKAAQDAAQSEGIGLWEGLVITAETPTEIATAERVKKIYVAKGKYGLSVDSTPDGARVELNNRKRKYAADTTYITSLKTPTVEVSMEGYPTLTVELVLTERTVQYYMFDLEKQEVRRVA